MRGGCVLRTGCCNYIIKKSVTNREQKMTKYEMILSVYHTHSISVTAEKYNYTQSAISQAIKSFEKELGLQLFKRTKNGMLPISNTEEIIRELRTICDAENRIADIASNLTSLKNGYIHIGTIKSIAYNWLPSMVKSFSKKYPNIHFKISMGSSSQLHDKLDQNEVYCIFVFNYLLPPIYGALQTDIGRGISERQRIGSGDRSVLGICKRMEIK